MNKLSGLFLLLSFILLPLSVKAEGESGNDDDSRYLVGAVPEVNGRVVFSKTYQIPGLSQDEIYRRAMNWMEKRLQKNNNPISRIAYSNEQEGSIAGIGEEWIVFKSTALSLDRTLINYQLTALCKSESFEIKIEKIRFTYGEDEKYTAEEWITDRYALNKSKTKLVRGLAKWRRKTVDFADATFNEITTALGQSVEQTEAAAKVTKKAPVKNDEPVIIHTETTVKTIPATPLVPAKQIEQPSSETPGYLEVNLKQIPGEVFAYMGSSKWVITIGSDPFNMTTMTANSGGAIGYQSGKAVAFCSLSPDQSFDKIEKAETYILKLYSEGNTQPQVIIHCQKAPTSVEPANGVRTYVGEIVKLLVRK